MDLKNVNLKDAITAMLYRSNYMEGISHRTKEECEELFLKAVTTGTHSTGEAFEEVLIHAGITVGSGRALCLWAEFNNGAFERAAPRTLIF